MNTPLDTLNIDTPENVTFSYEVAGIGSRFLAAGIDTLLLGLLQLIVIGTAVLVLLRLGNINLAGSSGSPASQSPYWILGILTFIGFVFFWGYYIFFETFWNGQTPGKRWIGLRVIRSDGTPVTFPEVLIRNVVRTLDLLPAAYGVGVVTMFINTNSCRLGDLAAKTVVVHDRQASLSYRPTRMQDELTLLHGHVELPPDFPIEKITDQDVQALESFFARRTELANRKQLASYILNALRGRLEMDAGSSEPGSDPEDMLVAIYQAKRGANREAVGGGRR